MTFCVAVGGCPRPSSSSFLSLPFSLFDNLQSSSSSSSSSLFLQLYKVNFVSTIPISLALRTSQSSVVAVVDDNDPWGVNSRPHRQEDDRRRCMERESASLLLRLSYHRRIIRAPNIHCLRSSCSYGQLHYALRRSSISLLAIMSATAAGNPLQGNISVGGGERPLTNTKKTSLA